MTMRSYESATGLLLHHQQPILPLRAAARKTHHWRSRANAKMVALIKPPCDRIDVLNDQREAAGRRLSTLCFGDAEQTQTYALTAPADVDAQEIDVPGAGRLGSKVVKRRQEWRQ